MMILRWLLIVLMLPHLASAQVLPVQKDDMASEDEHLPAVIEADATELPSDDEIANRLSEIYGNLPGLENVTVEVNQGVVVLAGSVSEQSLSEKAASLAERVHGAVVVVNNLTRDRSIRSRGFAALESLEIRVKDFIGNAPLLLLAAAVVALAVFIARLAGKADGFYNRLSQSWFIRDLLRQAAQLAIVIAGIILALNLLDAPALLGSLAGALGLVGLAIGFATRDTVENYIASILLSIRQPFRREDYVSIEGVEGRVVRLTSRATVLMTLDGNHLRIPNAKVFKATITNYTLNPLRRFDFQVGVDTELDLQRPRELAVSTLARLPGVLDNPPPVCLIHALGDSSVILQVQAWIDQRETDFQKVRSEAQRLVKVAFDDAGIVMPEPIYNVNLRRPRAARREDQLPAAQIDGSSASASSDTAPDRAIEQQIDEEQRDDGGQDLLSHDAPRE